MVAVDQKMSFSFDLMALVFIRFQYFIIGDLCRNSDNPIKLRHVSIVYTICFSFIEVAMRDYINKLCCKFFTFIRISFFP